MFMAAITVAGSTVTGAPAGAAGEPSSGFCRGTSGPTCQFEYGNVLEGHGTDDGDGIKATIDGRGSDEHKVRLTGVNSMELHEYGLNDERGECHAVAATRRLRHLIDVANDNKRGRVRLAAQDLATAVSGDRLRRSVAIQIDGKWRDLGRILVAEGHVLPHINNSEWAWNTTYRHLAQRAAFNGRKLWNTEYCGVGPRQGDVDNKVDMYVHWDAEGVDTENLNGEWVRLRNRSDRAIDIGGWWLRDSDTRRRHGRGYTFPSTAKIPAYGTITLHVGDGTNGSGHYYFKQQGAIFDNVSYDKLGIGDGAYLFDKDGDLRKWQMYPCDYACNDPLKGKINVTAKPTGVEYISVENISATTVDLAGHRIVNDPYSYPITSRTLLAPNETLKLYVLSGTSNGLTRYWGKANNILNDGGDVVSVRTFDDIVTDCYTWGSGTC